MSGMKDILAQYQKQYAKRMKQSPEQRDAESAVWLDMTGNIRQGGMSVLDDLAKRHTVIETEWLTANKATHTRSSVEFKAVANRHIKIRNSFAILYKVEPEDLLK